MKISIANKRLTTKPQTNQEKARYFKDLAFTTYNVKLEDLATLVGQGATITYTFKDSHFTRSNNYMSHNYKGTQFICVDIDKCSITPNDFVQGLIFQPYLVHTTFSNMSEAKDNLFCFHLIYVLDKEIEGEEAFQQAFENITNSYSEYVDQAAKDCHRVIFTSNSQLPNYECTVYGNITKVEDILTVEETEKYDTLEAIFSADETVSKFTNATIFTFTNNIVAKEKNETKQTTNNFSLSDTFFADLNGMSRKDFIQKYESVYHIQRSTPITQEMVYDTREGIIFADLRDIEYYEVPSKYRWNAEQNKYLVSHVQNGQRTKQLMYDAVSFRAVNPSITKEELVYSLVNEVWRYYDNKDKELSNYKILGIAKFAYELEKVNVEPIKRKYKLISHYGYTNTEAVGIMNKYMKDAEIGEWYDGLQTVEENLQTLKKNGISCKKERLIQFIEDWGFEPLTIKDIRNNKILAIWEENKEKSIRELVEVCKDNGVKVSKDTIQRVIAKYGAVSKNTNATISISYNNIVEVENFGTPKETEQKNNSVEYSWAVEQDEMEIAYREANISWEWLGLQRKQQEILQCSEIKEIFR